MKKWQVITAVLVVLGVFNMYFGLTQHNALLFAISISNFLVAVLNIIRGQA